MTDINILSWNVRGLNSPIKRTRCLEFLHRKRVSIALIQETHLTATNVHRFQNKHYKIIADSCASTKARGVLIIADRKLQFVVMEKGNDNDGRFAYILLSINYAKLLLASIYAPNVFDKTFLPSISVTLSRYLDPHCIIAGDYNAIVSRPQCN